MYIFGLLDLISAVSIILLKFDMGIALAWFCAIYLLAKGIPFIKDPASIADIISAGIILLGIFGFFGIYSYIAIIWLLQKALFSFF